MRGVFELRVMFNMASPQVFPMWFRKGEVNHFVLPVI